MSGKETNTEIWNEGTNGEVIHMGWKYTQKKNIHRNEIYIEIEHA